MKKDTRSLALIALAKAYEQNNTAITSRIEAILIPDEQELPKELQECLESWGSTPIEEPEYFEASKTAKVEEIKEMAVKELDIDSFTAIDVGTFANRLYRQVTDKIDKDGMYKSTPSIDSVKLPKTTQVKKLKQMATDKIENEEIKKELFKIAGVNQEDITEWEAELIQEMMFGYIQAVDSDTMGKHSDRTPFARYLKNV
jgi:hypothetical protein